MRPSRTIPTVLIVACCGLLLGSCGDLPWRPGGLVAGESTGDGAIDISDFNIITAHFLEYMQGGCCGRRPSAGPRSSITIRELEQLGLSGLRAADLNHDGVLNLADVTAFGAGVR
jgi:hypothetical protein